MTGEDTGPRFEIGRGIIHRGGRLAKAGRDLHRIKAVKLRGIVSFGLLSKAPEGAALGDDVAEQLGVTHYEPAMLCGNTTGGEAESPPALPAPSYDLDTLRRYKDRFVPGEPVYCTEKIHGTSSRFVFDGERMFAGSRKEWKTPDSSNVYWTVLKHTPALEAFCRANPGDVVYGEVYGWVQELRYGHTSGRFSFAAFDIFKDGQYLNHEEARALAPNIPWVPVVAGPIPFDFDALCEMSDGISLVPGANHIREGIVVSPKNERFDDHIGRVKLKLVGATYLSS